MRLAIGDVVRDRTDEALGTVAGLGQTEGPSVVLVSIANRGVRPAKPDNVELIARHRPRMSTVRAVFVLVLFVCGLGASFMTTFTIADLGGNWLLQTAAGLGTFQLVAVALKGYGALTGPRRFRV